MSNKSRITDAEVIASIPNAFIRVNMKWQVIVPDLLWKFRLQQEGVRSKKYRVQKRVVKRVITKILLRGLNASTF